MIESNLNLFKKDVYSQFGEDGIIEELINRLGKKKTFNVANLALGMENFYLTLAI